MNPKSLANLRPIQPGETRNPGGKPVGTRNAVTKRFLEALAKDFEAGGKEAIEQARLTDPMGYMKALVALCPKEVDIKHTNALDEMSAEELAELLAKLDTALAAQAVQLNGGARH